MVYLPFSADDQRYHVRPDPARNFVHYLANKPLDYAINSKQHLGPTPKCLYGGTWWSYIICMLSERQQGQPMVYQMRVKGHLGSDWTDWFEGLTITLQDNGDTLLTGPVIDQAALHGLLKKIRDLGMLLISVNYLAPAASTTLTTGQPDAGDGQ
jgi:hypothetical protein